MTSTALKMQQMNGKQIPKLTERDSKINDFTKKHFKAYESIELSARTQILHSKAHEIYKNICEKRSWKAVNVVLVFCFASIESNKTTNCLTEVMFEEAMNIAKNLDDEFEISGVPVGPLHGIPFSVKDTFNVKGYDSSIGLVKNCHQPKDESSSLVNEVIRLGGIPFVKTNVPQTLMSFECSNPVWGVTSNTVNQSLSPGGSSGGEAAIISSNGSVIGLGSDIGGSLRIPAHFSGICALKPSYKRLSNIGTTSCKPIHVAIEAVSGPMATCVEDLLLFCKATFGHGAQDVIPLKFNMELSEKPIVFAFSKNCPFMKASPACSRAMEEVVLALKSNGHIVIEYEFPKSFEKLVPAFYSLMSADGWKFYFEKLKGEIPEKNIIKLLNYARLPNWIKKIVAFFARIILKDSRAISIINAISSKNVYEILKLKLEINDIAKDFHQSIADKDISVLLMPTHVLPATKNGSFGNIHFTAAYTFAWNLLNQPIGVLPVTHFDKSKDLVPDVWPREFKFSDIFSKDLLDRAAQSWYNPDFLKLPIGVQVIGKSYEDELVLQAMKIIQDLN